MQTIYLVPHTHYDVAWAFTREEYFMINESILEQALAIMETADFKFCIEQTYLLHELEMRNPDLWARIHKMIKAGKIHIIDGQFLMPDTLIPKGEVLVREILLGKKYCQEKFGIDVPVAWAADSFGMNAQLPQIYRKSGYKWLAFRRGARQDISESEFLWKALDGSTILTHWMPLGYRAGLFINEWYHSFTELNKFAATPHILMPSGSGSMPPQSEIPESINHWNQNYTHTHMKMATPEEFFEALEKTGKQFKVIEGELYDDELVDVFPQVCSSRMWVIQQYRECETLIATTEKFATVAWLLGAQYPDQELKEVWEMVLFTVFHDIITGCGVDDIYDEVREMFTNIITKLNDILTKSLNSIAERISTDGPAMIAFNSLPWQVKNWTQVADKPGFLANLPPLGYKVYKPTSTIKEGNKSLVIKDNKITTDFWTLEIDENTGIIKVFDKDGNLLLGGNDLVIDDEVGDLYHHRSRFTPSIINTESGEGFQYGSFKPKNFKIKEIDSGVKIIYETEYYCLTWPYRLKDRFPPQIYKYKTLDVIKEITIYRDLPRIEFIMKIDNKYPNIRLRVKFDTGIDRKNYYRETQFGVVPEPTQYITKSRDAKPSGIPNFLDWFDINDGVRGVTFMNKGLPAVDISKGDVYITLFRSISGLSADGTAGPLVPTPDALELKAFNVEGAIQLHEGDWRQAEMYKSSLEYNHPPVTIEANSSGDLPSEFSFLKIHPNNILLSALKKAEDSDELIIRVYETKGEETIAEIELFTVINKVKLVDLLEREEEDLPFSENKVILFIKPFEIVTLKVDFIKS